MSQISTTLKHLFLEAQYGNEQQASKGQKAEDAFVGYFEGQARAKNCILQKSSTYEDRVLHIDYFVTNKRMEPLKSIFPISEKKFEFGSLSPEELKGLGANRLSKMTMDDLTSLSDEQKAAIFDVLPPEYQELLTTEETSPIKTRVAVEIKGIKNDILNYTPIEIETGPDTRGMRHPGWVYGSSDLIAFALGETASSEDIKYFLMVETVALADKIRSFEKAGKIKMVTDKKMAKSSLQGDSLTAYVRMTDGEARGRMIYIPTQELISYKRGSGVLTIKKK